MLKSIETELNSKVRVVDCKINGSSHRITINIDVCFQVQHGAATLYTTAMHCICYELEISWGKSSWPLKISSCALDSEL